MKHKHMTFQQELAAWRIKRLQFAVRFAQMDLETLRAGDWLNLREDLLAFLGEAPGQNSVVSPYGGLVTGLLHDPRPAEFSADDFRALQGEVRTLLSASAGEDMSEQPPIQITPILRSDLFDAHAYKGGPTGGYLMHVHGTTRDVFLFMLLSVLQQEPPDRVLRCAECQMLFVRAYTQLYCSRRCTNRASIRNWRTRHAADPLPQ